jgi:hypothetical protein
MRRLCLIRLPHTGLHHTGLLAVHSRLSLNSWLHHTGLLAVHSGLCLKRLTGHPWHLLLEVLGDFWLEHDD